MRVFLSAKLLQLLRVNLFFVFAFSITNSNVFGGFLCVFLALTLALLVFDWPSPAPALFSLKSYWIATGPLVFLSLLSVVWFGLPIGRAEILEVFLVGSVFYLGLQKMALKENDIFRAMQAAILFGLCVALYERFVLGIDRVASAGVSIDFGIAAALATAYLFVKAMSEEVRDWRLIFACAGGVLLIALSQSRGPALALGVAIVFVVYFAAKGAAFKIDANRTLAVLAAAAGLGVALLAIIVSPRTLSEFDGMRIIDESASGLRLQMLGVGVQSLAKHPWIGVGADQAGAMIREAAPHLSSFNTLHNSVVNLSVELGIFGGLAYLWIYISMALVFRATLRRGDFRAAVTGLAIAIVLLVASLTQDIVSAAYTRQLMAVYMALTFAFALKTSDQSS